MQGSKRMTACNSDGLDLRLALLIMKDVVPESDAALVLHRAWQ
jgi:hypothetical protein